MAKDDLSPILITAGPTWEPIDAVRFIGNRSSGRMGIAIAQAAVEAGHEVILALGPGTVPPPAPMDRLAIRRFETCDDLETLLAELWPAKAKTLIMAAAVADFRPATPDLGSKHRRTAAGWMLNLVETPDLVADCATRKPKDGLVVAFALEPKANLELLAGPKMERKGVDAIVGNPLETMESGDVEACLLWADANRENVATEGAMSKIAFGRWLMAQLATNGK